MFPTLETVSEAEMMVRHINDTDQQCTIWKREKYLPNWKDFTSNIFPREMKTLKILQTRHSFNYNEERHFLMRRGRKRLPDATVWILFSWDGLPREQFANISSQLMHCVSGLILCLSAVSEFWRCVLLWEYYLFCFFFFLVNFSSVPKNELTVFRYRR